MRRGSKEHRHSATQAVTHQVDVGRETFYARESDGTKYTTAKRRHAITAALREVLHNHSLHGEVIVRVLHESEIALLHTVPKLDQSKRAQVNIVRCVGEHHKELFHEILDYFDEIGYDVMHADMDMDNKNQENTVFYVMLPEEQTDHPDKRHDLQQAIQKLYSSHSVRGQVTVESGEGMSPPSTPGSPANNPNGTPSKTKRNSLPQLLLDEMSARFPWSSLCFRSSTAPSPLRTSSRKQAAPRSRWDSLPWVCGRATPACVPSTCSTPTPSSP